MTKHGTTSRYTRGCRCARCRAANAGYQRAYQAKRRAEPKATFHFHVGGQPITKGQVHLVGDKGPERFVTASVNNADFTVDTRTSMERLVDACVDLREAFAAYHQAHTDEPVA